MEGRNRALMNQPPAILTTRTQVQALVEERVRAIRDFERRWEQQRAGAGPSTSDPAARLVGASPDAGSGNAHPPPVSNVTAPSNSTTTSQCAGLQRQLASLQRRYDDLLCVHHETERRVASLTRELERKELALQGQLARPSWLSSSPDAPPASEPAPPRLPGHPQLHHPLDASAHDSSDSLHVDSKSEIKRLLEQQQVLVTELDALRKFRDENAGLVANIYQAFEQGKICIVTLSGCVATTMEQLKKQLFEGGVA